MACVYGVRHKATDTIRLVEADNQAQALRHVAGSDYEITRPAGREISELGRGGVFVEVYGAEPEATADLATEQKGQGDDEA